MPSRPASRLLVTLAAAVAGGALAARPTGVGPLDVAWSAAYVGALAYASVTAPRLHLLAAAGLASVLAETRTSLAAAVVATALAAFHATRGRAWPHLAGATGGLLGLALLSGNGPDDPWLRALTTTGLTVFVGLMGLRGMSRRRRRRVVRWAAAGAGVLLLCGAAGSLAALRARGQIDDGIDAFRAAQRAAAGADLAAAVDAFGDAEGAFDDAAAQLEGIGRLGRIVPGLSQQLGAASTAVDAAEQAAEAARVAGGQIDLDAVGVRDGAVDLAAVRAAEAPVAGLVATLLDTIDRLARIDRGFLVAPVTEALDDALNEARDAGASIDRLHRGVRVAPALLGGERPVRYLVLFTSPVEARGRFGFPGAYAVLTADQGRLAFEEGGPIGQVNPAGGFDQLDFQVPIRAQPYLPYGVARDWRSVTIPAHGPAVADLAAQMAAQTDVGAVDGVVLASPQALATILGVVGDIPLPEVDTTLTEANAVDFLTREQYLAFPELGEQQDRKDLLGDVAGIVGGRLDQLSLPRAQDLVDRFGPLVARGDLVLSVPDAVSAEAADLLADVGLDGGFPDPGGDDADVVLVTQRNVVGNKIDLFLRRQLTYDVAVDRSGQARGELVVELTNDVPARDLPPYLVGSALNPEPPEGTNLSTTLVYSRYPLTELELDGQALLPPVFVEGGFHVYQVQIDLARGQTRTLRARFAAEAVGPEPYEVVVEPSGLVHPDEVTVRVRDDRVGRSVESTTTVREPICTSLRRDEARCR